MVDRVSEMAMTVSNDHRKAMITFPGAWFGLSHPIALSLDTSEMDSLIASLGRLREAMLDRPPLDLQLKEVHGTINPRWQVTQQPSGDSALSLRHEGFGWVHFGLPKPEAASLGRALLLHSVDHSTPSS